jgi:hypothetical protein
MTTNFLSLPSELRNRIYELVLLDERYINSWACSYSYRPPTIGLLCANKTIHREASSLLYAQNRFDLTANKPQLVAFLDQIGCNATYIRHICIKFPTFCSLDRHNVTLEDDSLHILAKIQSVCTNLSTLATTLYSTDAVTLELDALDNPNIVVQALAHVNAHFRAILSLQEIVVEIYEERPSAHTRKTMENLGWNLELQENSEEEGSERSFGDEGDVGYLLQCRMQ